MPVESASWFLIGDCYDQRCETQPGLNDYQQMVRMPVVTAQPAMVCRIACHALLENEHGDRWIEPMVYVSAVDQENWLSRLSACLPACLAMSMGCDRG
jgi:hypothetical protein